MTPTGMATWGTRSFCAWQRTFTLFSIRMQVDSERKHSAALGVI